MADNRTLVAFVTKGGATEEYARTIADVLRRTGLQVDVTNLKDPLPDISAYKNVVAGSGIRKGKSYKEFDSFMKRDFGNRKVAVFFASGEAGDPKTYQSFMEKQIKPLNEKYPSARIISAQGFGGKMKILWKVAFDNRDIKKAEAWAEKIGSIFRK